MDEKRGKNEAEWAEHGRNQEDDYIWRKSFDQRAHFFVMFNKIFNLKNI